jgi:hypothetical protein
MDTLPFHEVLVPVPESTNEKIETYSGSPPTLGIVVADWFLKPAWLSARAHLVVCARTQSPKLAENRIS